MLDSSEEVKKLDLFLLLMSKFVFIQKEQAVKKCVRRRRHQNVVSHSYSGKMSSFLCIFLYSNSMVKYIKMTELFFPDGNRCDNFSTHSQFSLFSAIRNHFKNTYDVIQPHISTRPNMFHTNNEARRKLQQQN